MSQPGAAEVARAVEATWPPAARRRLGPWTIRDGRGGGQRVSSATAEAPVSVGDLAAAEAAMAELGQPAQMMVRPGEEALDALLDDAGYQVVDPVLLYAGDAARLAGPLPPPGRVFAVWPPLAIQRDLWAAGGIGPARVDVMQRTPAPRTTLLVRLGDQPAGTAFAAVATGIAMIHAIEVAPSARRAGVGRMLVQETARWAAGQGAPWLTLAVTRANGAANALYASLGMTVVGHYHYRKK